MSSEDYEVYRALKEQVNQEKYGRRCRAASDFETARDLAAQYSLTLKQHTDTHYQLLPVGRAWILNLYPGNQRLWSPPAQRFGYLRLPSPWSLLDVVRAAVDKLSQDQPGSIAHPGMNSTTVPAGIAANDPAAFTAEELERRDG